MKSCMQLKKFRASHFIPIFWREDGGLCFVGERVKKKGMSFYAGCMVTLEPGVGIRCFRSVDLSLIAKESKQSVAML